MEELSIVKAKNNELRNMAEAELVAKINDAHGRFVGGLKTSLEAAYEAGMFLNEVKRRLPHGQFTKWVKDNCRPKQRQVNSYMEVFVNWKTITKKFRAAQGHSVSITAALEEVRVEKGTKGRRTKACNVNSVPSDNTSVTDSNVTNNSVLSMDTSNPVMPSDGRTFSETKGTMPNENSIPEGNRDSGYTESC